MAKLATDNPELLIYIDGKLHITVLGGIKLKGLDRLKVTLKITLPPLGKCQQCRCQIIR